MMIMRVTKRFFVGLIVLIVGTKVMATPVQWPDNGHYYERIDNAGLTWTQAKSQAESMSYLGVSGHLLTITSQGEEDFIDVLLSQVIVQGGNDRFWIGGFQPPGSVEPAGGWEWVTVEPWDYTNWNQPLEPSNSGGNENALAVDAVNPGWNDVPENFGLFNAGYFVEYSIPEPSTFAFAILGLLSLGVIVRQRRRR